MIFYFIRSSLFPLPDGLSPLSFLLLALMTNVIGHQSEQLLVLRYEAEGTLTPAYLISALGMSCSPT
jgi:hypothetical protein